MRIRNFVAIVVLMMLAGCSGGDGQGGGAATPKQALASYASALEQGKLEAVKACLATDTDAQREFNAALTDMLAATQKLQAAARQKFNKDDAKQLTVSGGADKDSLRRFQDGEEKIEGTSAKLTSSTGTTMEFVKSGADWKIVPQAPGGGTLESATASLRKVASALDDIAGGISDGTIKDVATARATLARKAFVAAAPLAPATNPATSPIQ
jgi:Tfp pilus assembly protein PilE